MANDSRVNLKMLFKILTDKEIEELTERAIRQRNFYAANLLRWEQMSDLSRWRSQFNRRLYAAKTQAFCWAVAASCRSGIRNFATKPLIEKHGDALNYKANRWQGLLALLKP